MKALCIIVAVCGLALPSVLIAQADLQYRISPNDKLLVTVFQEEDLSGERVVASSGAITLPLVSPIKVGGKTPAEAEKLIVRAYVTGRVLKAPQVSVTVAEHAQKSVTVLGKVKKPGPVAIPPGQVRISLLDAIAAAGDFEGIAKTSRVAIKRKNGKREIVNVKEMLKSDGKVKPVYLYPGDLVSVGQRLL